MTNVSRIHTDGIAGVAKVEFDVAVHGGTVGDKPLDLVLPQGALVIGGYQRILTEFAGGGAAKVVPGFLSAEGFSGFSTSIAIAEYTNILGLFGSLGAGFTADLFTLCFADSRTVFRIVDAPLTAGKVVMFIHYLQTE